MHETAEAQEVQEMQDDESYMPDEEQSDVSQPDQEIATTVESVVEAVLFASDESLTEARLASIVETSTKQIRQHIKNLNDKYKANNNAFRIEQIAGGYQMLTLSPYNHWLKKLLRVRSDNKLSPAAMETLAIIAYKQPVMRADIEAIRGVAVGEVIRSLSYKGLVKDRRPGRSLGQADALRNHKKVPRSFRSKHAQRPAEGAGTPGAVFITYAPGSSVIFVRTTICFI